MKLWLLSLFLKWFIGWLKINSHLTISEYQTAQVDGIFKLMRDAQSWGFTSRLSDSP